MTIDTMLLIALRAAFKEAQELIAQGVASEAEAKELLQALRAFNRKPRSAAKAKPEDSQESKIHVESAADGRGRWDNDSPDTTQMIDVPFKKPGSSTK